MKGTAYILIRFFFVLDTKDTWSRNRDSSITCAQVESDITCIFGIDNGYSRAKVLTINLYDSYMLNQEESLRFDIIKNVIAIG